jgi:hypothetical protein
MPAKRPPRPGTLAALADSGHTIDAICDRCGHFSVAKLLDIAQRRGWGASAQEVGVRLRCSECGHRGGRLTTQRPQVGRSVCPRCQRPYR